MPTRATAAVTPMSPVKIIRGRCQRAARRSVVVMGECLPPEHRGSSDRKPGSRPLVGRRSSTDLGRAVVADALRVVDPVAAAAAEREADWRRGYLPHFRRLVEAGLADGGAAGYRIADAGLAALHARMRLSRDGADVPLAEAFRVAADRPLETVEVVGAGKTERELSLPYRGEMLHGGALQRQLDAWVAAGTMEQSCAGAVREVAANPDWLDLSDQRLVVLGAAAEMGPVPAVLGWGGTVVG